MKDVMRSNSYYTIASYKKINTIFIVIILFVFVYSFVAPYLKFAIASSCEGQPLIFCKSRGLTRAFSAIIRLDFDAALQFNSYSLKVALFFLMQLFCRVVINLWVNAKNYFQIVALDLLFSVSYFLFSFHDFVMI